MQWTHVYREQIDCFTNNIANKDGGTHMAGAASVDSLGQQVRATNSLAPKGGKADLSGEDVREGVNRCDFG